MWSRLFQPPEEHFFLFGPRGTGKSHWLGTQFPDAIVFDLLDDAVYRRLLADPGRIAERIPKSYEGIVVLDEVQRVPALLNEIHRLIEGRAKKQRLRFVMTGSSARKLRQKGTNLLAGRALVKHMHPMTCEELREDFDLTRSLRFGRLPKALTSAHPGAFLESYITTYLREEVQQERLVRNLEGFARFLEVASLSQGAPINISAIASDCSVGRKAVEDYFQILDDLLIASKIPVFTRRAKRKLAAAPKFYFFDPGVYQTLRPRGPIDSGDEIDGPSLETLILQELRAVNDYKELGYQINYWRTSDDHEVDFILYGPRGFHAIEVKRSPRLRGEELDSLSLFLDDYPQSKAHFVYGGLRHDHRKGIEIWPVEDFLKSIPKILVRG